MTAGPGRRVATAAVATALLAFLVASRAILLRAGLWNDEAFTALFFIDRGPDAILRGDYIANDHVLFNLLTWYATESFGREEFVYRLWSVVPGVLAIAALAEWTRRRLGVAVALSFLLIVSTSPLHLELAVQARGYGLGFAAMAMLLVAAAGRAGTVPPLPVLFAMAGIVGIWTLPVFVLPFLGEAAFLVSRPGARGRALGAVAAVGLASIAFYLPLLERIRAASGQDFGVLAAWTDVIDGPYRDLFSTQADRFALATSIPFGASVVLFWVLCGLGIGMLVRRGEGAMAGALVSPVVATYAGLAALGLQYVPRFVSYLLLPCALLLSSGIVALGRGVLHGCPPRTRRLACAAAFAVAAASVVDAAHLAIDWSKVPIESYREAIAVARRSGLRTVVVNSTYSAGFEWYGAGLRLVFPDPSALSALLCRRDQRFVFIDYPLRGRPFDPRCLRERGIPRVLVPQRAGAPDGEMSVWTVTDKSSEIDLRSGRPAEP